MLGGAKAGVEGAGTSLGVVKGLPETRVGAGRLRRKLTEWAW